MYNLKAKIQSVITNMVFAGNANIKGAANADVVVDYSDVNIAAVNIAVVNIDVAGAKAIFTTQDGNVFEVKEREFQFPQKIVDILTKGIDGEHVEPSFDRIFNVGLRPPTDEQIEAGVSNTKMDKKYLEFVAPPTKKELHVRAEIIADVVEEAGYSVAMLAVTQPLVMPLTLALAKRDIEAVFPFGHIEDVVTKTEDGDEKVEKKYKLLDLTRG